MSKLLTPQEVFEAVLDGKEVQYKHLDNVLWHKLTKEIIKDITFGKLFNGTFVFRLYQQTRKVGGVEFPKPESEPLEKGTEYWVVNPVCEYYTALDSCCWDDDDFDELYLHRGLIHLSQENAIAHAKALIKLSGGNVDD